MGIVRGALTLFLGALLYGYAKSSAQRVGLPGWAEICGLVTIGIALQLIYTRLLNRHFDSAGLPESIRVRLRSDLGVAPLWLQTLGVFAKCFFAAGILFPVLASFGIVKLESVRLP